MTASFTPDQRQDFIDGYTEAALWANAYGPANCDGLDAMCVHCDMAIMALGADGLSDWVPAGDVADAAPCEHEPELTSLDLSAWQMDERSRAAIETECDEFLARTEPMLRVASRCRPERGMAYHGHDFALTRNNHGTGFWDRGYPERLGRALSEVARGYGELSVWPVDAVREIAACE